MQLTKLSTTPTTWDHKVQAKGQEARRNAEYKQKNTLRHTHTVFFDVFSAGWHSYLYRISPHNVRSMRQAF